MTDQTPDETNPQTANPQTANPQTVDRRPLIALAWAWVGVPFAYGVYELFLKVTQLFKG